MKSFTTLKNLYISLSNNSSTQNETLGAQTINDTQRLLLQKYFNNEGSYRTTTIGAMDLTLTGSLSVGNQSATLSSAWNYPAAIQSVTFSSGETRMVQFFSGSTSITWIEPLTETATDSISTQGVQGYFLPPLYSKMKDLTITLGSNGLKYTPTEILTRVEWDQINMLPYTSDIPNYYFIYDGVVNIFPIPSSTGNQIQMNYKFRVPDLALADYSTGTVTVTNSSATVTGSGTSWLTPFLPSAGTATNLNLWIKFNAPAGDGNWYQINNIASATALTLMQPYQGTSAASVTFTIGQMPLLLEDFHDLLVYRPLFLYFTSTNPDASRANEFKGIYEEGIQMLNDYSGTKSVNVDLGTEPEMVNPNLFFFA